MSRCDGPDCSHSSHETLKIKGPSDPAAANPPVVTGTPPQPKVVDAPDHAVFRVGEVVALKGWHFRFVGYTRGNWELVFEAVSRTGKSRKRPKWEP